MTGLHSPASRRSGPLRVLLITTRDIGQRATGRIVVLRTHAQALAALGHEVSIAVVAPTPAADTEWTRRFHTTHVRSPRLPSIAVAALHTLTFGTRSLNEALFSDRSVRRSLAQVAARLEPDVVVVDTLRLFPATVGIDAPVVVDLDDLLSLRYQRLHRTARDDASAVLGFAAEWIPGHLRGIAGLAVRSLLGWEARRIEERELAVAGAADVVSLVSDVEARLLSHRTGRDVAWLPPAVPIPQRAVEPGHGLVFLGGLDYVPNVLALRFYRDEVLPYLDAADPRMRLSVIGQVPEPVRREFEVPGIELLGYVEDLHEALSRRLLIAPVVTPGGVKLKVLDAMAHGLPVVGTPLAFDGLALPEGLRAEAHDGRALAKLVLQAVDDAAWAADLGRAARVTIAAEFDLAAAARRWAVVLEGLTGTDRGR